MPGGVGIFEVGLSFGGAARNELIRLAVCSGGAIYRVGMACVPGICQLFVLFFIPMNRCPHCGYRGRPRWENSWLAWVAGLVWLLPIGFLSMGYWPFFLLPSIAITVWAWFAVQFTCPVCRGNWKP